MSQAFESLRALTNDVVRIDVPVPACLNHCINQEVFYCKVCGEVFDNIHKYISHGKLHRSTSTICSWCGGSWPTYSALCIHQLVWDSVDGQSGQSTKTSDEVDDHIFKFCCPLSCGVEASKSQNMMESHLLSFHGASQNQINISKQGGETRITVDKKDNCLSCPKCSTAIFSKVNLNIHMAFNCYSRSAAVKRRTEGFLNSDVYSDNPLLPLNQEIQALILHLTDLLENGSYRDSFEEEALKADEKYNKLPAGFSKEYLAWLPLGYTLQVLKSEQDNFGVMFDVWSQVVDKLSGPQGLQDITQKLESQLSDQLTSGMVSRWPPLMFDTAMLDTPDQDVINSLEAQLGWVK